MPATQIDAVLLIFSNLLSAVSAAYLPVDRSVHLERASAALQELREMVAKEKAPVPTPEDK